MKNLIFKLTIASLFVLVVTGCRLQKFTPQQQRIAGAETLADIFQLEKQIQLKFPGTHSPKNICDVLLLPNRTFCVLTKGQNAGAFLFDVNGKCINILAPKMEMNNRFGQPWQAQADRNGNIHIFDIEKNKIFSFDQNGTYTKSCPAPKKAASFLIAKSGNFIFNQPLAFDETTIFETNPAGLPERSFALMPIEIQTLLKVKTVLAPRPLLAHDNKENFYQAFAVAHPVYKYTADARYVGAFAKTLQRTLPVDEEMWYKVARMEKPPENAWQSLLSNATLTSGVYCVSQNVVMMEFLNIKDKTPRYMVFHNSEGDFLAGDFPYDISEWGKLLRVEKERMFTYTKTTAGPGNNSFTLNIYLMPRR